MATTILLHNNCSLKWSVETQHQKFNSIGFLLHTRMKKRAKWRPNIVFETRVNFLPVSDGKHNSLRRSILQDLHHFVTTIAC